MAKGPRTVLALPDGIREHWDLPPLDDAVALGGGYHNLLVRTGPLVLRMERNDWWDWSVVPKPPELVRAFEHTRAWIASRPELAVTPIHGDPAQQNLLWRAGRPTALLDWEWARLDWPALELAAAALSFAEDDREAFVAAYRAAGGPGEPEAFEEGERIVVLANALYSLTRGAEDRDWIDYLLARLRELP